MECPLCGIEYGKCWHYVCRDCGTTATETPEDPTGWGIWWQEGDGTICEACHLKRDAEREAGTRKHYWELPDLGCNLHLTAAEAFGAYYRRLVR